MDENKLERVWLLTLFVFVDPLTGDLLESYVVEEEGSGLVRVSCDDYFRISSDDVKLYNPLNYPKN